jgi:hypothetical protein
MKRLKRSWHRKRALLSLEPSGTRRCPKGWARGGRLGLDPDFFSLVKTCKLNVHKEDKNLEVTEYRNGYESLIGGMSMKV